MKTPTTNADFFRAELAAKTLPEPTAAAIEDRDGWRFAAIRVGEIEGAPVYQWALMCGTGWLSDWRFRRPWIGK